MGPSRSDPGERARIEAALVSLVVEHGYAELRLEAILERARVGRSAFEHEFGTIEQCFAATWERIDTEARARTGKAMSSADGWRGSFRSALAVGLQFLAEDPERARFYVVEVVAGPEAVRMLRDRSAEGVRATIAAGDPKAERPELLTCALADGIAGGIWTRISTVIGEGRSADLPGELPQLMYFAVLPYFGRDVADHELARGWGH